MSSVETIFLIWNLFTLPPQGIFSLHWIIVAHRKKKDKSPVLNVVFKVGLGHFRPGTPLWLFCTILPPLSLPWDAHLGRVERSAIFLPYPQNKALCSGLGQNEVGQSMQGRGECALCCSPAPFSLSLHILNSPSLPPLPALYYCGEWSGREGGGSFIQHRLNVFTVAQCRGGVGRCKAARGTNGGTAKGEW